MRSPRRRRRSRGRRSSGTPVSSLSRLAESVPSYRPPKSPKDNGIDDDGIGAERARPDELVDRQAAHRGARRLERDGNVHLRATCCPGGQADERRPWDWRRRRAAPPAKSLANAISLSRLSEPALIVSSPAGADMSVMRPLAAIDVSSAASSIDRRTMPCPSMTLRCCRAASAFRSRSRRRAGRSRRSRRSRRRAPPAASAVPGRAAVPAAEGRQRQLDPRLRQPHARRARCAARGGPGSSVAM